MDFARVRNTMFIASLAVISLLFLYTVLPFGYPILWAAIIAGMFYPLYEKINKSLHHPNLSATLILVTVFTIIVLPLTLIGTLLVQESVELYSTINTNKSQIATFVQNAVNTIQQHTITRQLNFDQKFLVEKLSEVTSIFTNFTLHGLTNFTQGSFEFLALFAIMFYALFFFLRDGEQLLLKLMHLSPLGDRYEKKLYLRFTSTARAMLKGTVIVAGIQSTLGVIALLICGVPGAFLLGLVMFFSALIPAVSAALVWFPVGIGLLLIGSIWQGVFLLVFGLFVISTIDNILRPILIGKDSQMHPLFILFSTLGGIVVFGLSGFILGPIITALFLSFWEMYEEYYKNELSNN